jgi:hypothetical protein
MKRLKCAVPFCGRTTSRSEFNEWLCGDHWRQISKIKRRVYGRLTKKWRRYHHLSDGIRADRIWNRLKREAIERAVGL